MRTKLLKTFVCSVMLIGISVVLPSHAKGKPDKMELCHLNDEGGFNRLNLPQGAFLGHLMHHDGDILPNGEGECIEEVTYEIGDTGPGGGIVFQVTDGGLHGLEAAPVDQSRSVWCDTITDVAGVDTIGASAIPDSHSGAHNTPLIAAACASSAADVAAEYELNGVEDWFLPNKEELNLLYAQRAVVGIGFDGYWSSSEFDASRAWLQDFLDGNRGITLKVNTRSVRAVRAF